MGNPIVKLEGKYLVWSTISDSPTTYGMTLAQLRRYVKEEDGRRGLEELARRLERVEEKGTSSHLDKNADDTIWLNRAGPDEQTLHREEIVEFFVRRRKEPTKAALAAFREGLERCGPACPAIERDGCAKMCERCWGTDYVRRRSRETGPERPFTAPRSSSAGRPPHIERDEKGRLTMMTKEQHRALSMTMGMLQAGAKEGVDLVDRRAPLATVRLHLDDLANLVARMRCAVDEAIAAESILSRVSAPGLAKGVRR